MESRPLETRHSRYRTAEADPELEREFRALVEEWINDTAYSSDPTEKFMHHAHLKIIGMGTQVVPLILREVQKMSGHWFLALESITKANPVTPKDEVSLERTANAWLEWGRREGLL